MKNQRNRKFILSVSSTISMLFFFMLVFHSALYAQQIDIRSFGACAGGTALNTRSIQAAIDSTARSGGGRVYVPPGTFLTGTIQLRDNVDIYLERGAVLKGSPHVEDYMLNGRLVGLIFTQNVKNVSISGLGTIDGSSDAFMELDRYKSIDNEGKKWTRQKDRFRQADSSNDGPYVPKDRPFQMIIFSDCRNVTVRDVTILNSPLWALHFADCDGVLAAKLRVWCDLRVPNNDGIDLTSCSNAIVSDCDFRTGDDCIAITGYQHHHDLPGFKDIQHVSENIVVTNCTMVSRSAAIRIGGFDQNSMRNYVFSNITITHSNRGIGIFARDAGSIENVLFTNIIIETRLHTGDWWGQGEPIHISAVRLTKDVPLGKIKNIQFHNILCKGESGILVYGTEENVIEDVLFRDVRFQVCAGKQNDISGGNFDLRPVGDPTLQLFAHDIPGLYAQWVKNLRIEGFDLTWDTVKQPFFTHGIEVGHFDGLNLSGYTGAPSPSNPDAVSLYLHDGKGGDIVLGKNTIRKVNVVP
ncbi:MAG: glycosyl hydrolase family 28 protein [Bacteroidota bacterium]